MIYKLTEWKLNEIYKKSIAGFVNTEVINKTQVAPLVTKASDASKVNYRSKRSNS